MADLLRLLGTGWACAAGVMILLWLSQLRTRNAGIVDVGWAAITGSLAILYGLLGDGDPSRRILLAVLGGVWGWRLAWHLWRDRIWKQPEEGRYVTLRKQWSPHPDRAFFIFFQAQALAAVVLSLPFALAGRAPQAFPAVTDLAALALVVIGVAGETVADRQLVAFKRDPASRGRTCRAGLWRYSRHPNYFGEFLIWWGFYLVALPAGGWWTVYAPLLMSFLLLRVSGVVLMEKDIGERRPAYRAYVARTSAFFPWPPTPAMPRAREEYQQ